MFCNIIPSYEPLRQSSQFSNQSQARTRGRYPLPHEIPQNGVASYGTAYNFPLEGMQHALLNQQSTAWMQFAGMNVPPGYSAHPAFRAQWGYYYVPPRWYRQ